MKPSMMKVYMAESIKKIAVLFTDIIGSTNFFKSHGNLAGRKMLQRHEDIVSRAIARFGGTVVKNLGDSVMAYFPNPQEALKVSINIQKELQKFNLSRALPGQIHIRIGIHFGEGLIEADDIFGDVVNVASKLTNLASSDQICISREVYTQVISLPTVRVETVDLPDKPAIPSGLTIYKVLWRESAPFEPVLNTVVYLKPLWELGIVNLDYVWKKLIKVKNRLWGRKIEGNRILNDKSILIMTKKPAHALDIAHETMQFLKDGMTRVAHHGIIPVQIVIDSGPYLAFDAITESWNSTDWDRFRPGAIYISSDTHTLLEEDRSVSVTFAESGENTHSYHEIKLDEYVHEEDLPLFLYQHALSHGRNAPCFYCGSGRHRASECPSKHITDLTGALNRLGYKSFDTINDLFLSYLKSIEQTEGTAIRTVDDPLDFEHDAHLAFYELTQVFQLRFFKTIWNAGGNDWDKIITEVHGADTKGGYIWLAQDCIRVSNLTQAESLLNTCIDQFPYDYRVYAAMAYLNVEKGNNVGVEYYLNKALYLARTTPQKIFILLLLCRYYDYIDNAEKVREKLREIFFIHPYCPEALYQDILHKFRHGNESEAFRQLIKLILIHRTYYIVALIDPELARHSRLIHPKLKDLFMETRKEAQKMAVGAEKEFARLATMLGEEDEAVTKTKELLVKAREMEETNSYFGALDMMHLSKLVMTTCRRLIEQRKREFTDRLSELDTRVKSYLGFLEQHRHRNLVGATHERLKDFRDTIDEAWHTLKSNDGETFKHIVARCGSLAAELDHMQPKIDRLRTIVKFESFVVSFCKNACVILAAILIVGTLIFPNMIYYLNMILPEQHISTAHNTWLYQKQFIIGGTVLGLLLAFIKAFKRLIKS